MSKLSLFFFLVSLLVSGLWYKDHIHKVVTANPALEKDYAVTKMNQYPPSLWPLANIIENRPESKTYFKLEKNFTDIFDLRPLVRNYSDLLLLVLSIALILFTAKSMPLSVILVSLPAILVLTLIGSSREAVTVNFLPLVVMCLMEKIWEKQKK